MLYIHDMSRDAHIENLSHRLTLIGATCLGRAARRTANLITRVYNHRLAPMGLEVTQFSILSTIALGRAKSASELADLVGVERSTLARNLDRLIDAGLVTSTKGDGRRLIYELTSRGAEMIERALPLWKLAQDELVEQLPHSGDDTIRDDFRLLRRAAKAVLAKAS